MCVQCAWVLKGLNYVPVRVYFGEPVSTLLICFYLPHLVSSRLAVSSCVTALFWLGLFWGLPRSHRLSSHSRLNAFVIQTKLNFLWAGLQSHALTDGFVCKFWVSLWVVCCWKVMYPLCHLSRQVMVGCCSKFTSLILGCWKWHLQAGLRAIGDSYATWQPVL